MYKRQPPLDLDDACPGLFDRTASGQLKSLSVVLGQEIERFNKLTRRVLSSLKELQKAIKGIVVMTGELEQMYTDFLNNKVPGLWEKVAYPSLKPLGGWIVDYHRRIDFMRTWLTKGNPKLYWLSGFFFPQGFMTGVLQMHARRGYKGGVERWLLTTHLPGDASMPPPIQEGGPKPSDRR